MELRAPDQEAVIRVAVVDLERQFATIDSSLIEVTVRRIVTEWPARARVKSFVGIIALRHPRAELQQLAR